MVKEAFKLLGVPPERIKRLKEAKAKNIPQKLKDETVSSAPRKRGYRRRPPRNSFKRPKKKFTKNKNKKVFVLRDALPDAGVLLKQLNKKEGKG